MNEAIEGKDVIIEFLDPESGEMQPFICAENVSIKFTTNKIATKTRGDGRWENWIIDTKGYSVACDGVIPVPPYDADGVSVWTLYLYYDEMTDVPFRILFRDTNDNLIKAILGNLLVTDIDITGPMDYAGQSISFIGNGAPSVQDNLLLCQATIGSAEISLQTELTVHVLITDLLESTRIDFTIDGSGRYSQELLAGDTILALIPLQHPEAFVNGDHVLTLIPVCESGEDGAPYILNYTKT